MADRHMSIVDAHVILRRAGRILLLRRAAGTYAAGQLCLASGHLEAGESIAAAAARETYEETGIVLDPADMRSVLTMHQRNPDGQARFGFFFEPGRWDGEPVNREPGKHSELVWADPAALPTDTVDYTAKAVAAIEAGRSFTMNGWGGPAACPVAEADGYRDVIRRTSADTALTRARLQAPVLAQYAGRHWTASAIILHPSEDKVLLIDHVKSGYWLFPGGHVTPGETLAEAAIREVREETGIEAEIITGALPVYDPVRTHPVPFAVIEATAADPVNGQHQHVDALFVMRAASAQIGQLDRREVTGARWVSLDQMRKLNVPPELPAITEAAIAWAARQADPL